MIHTLTMVGYLGSFQCYLDTTKEEAIRRYRVRNPYIENSDPMIQPENVRVLEFDDEFEVYDARESE